MRADAASPAPLMTPGRYLRLRRRAARMTVQGVARAAVSSPVELAAAIEAIGNAEADRELLGDADLARLATVMRFDPRVYLGLVDGLTASGICRVCACSQEDACDDRGRGCAWTDHDRTLCTACSGRFA